MQRGLGLTRKRRLAWRGRSAFPEQRHPKFRAFVKSLDCVLAGRYTTARLCPYDVWVPLAQRAEPGSWTEYPNGAWRHVCWGQIDPAHVNETVARGAADVGEIVPLCRGAHRQLDQVLGATEFAQVTGLDLTHIAAGLPQTYVEQEGPL